MNSQIFIERVDLYFVSLSVYGFSASGSMEYHFCDACSRLVINNGFRKKCLLFIDFFFVFGFDSISKLSFSECVFLNLPISNDENRVVYRTF